MCSSSQEFFVVAGLVFLVESGRKTKVRQLDMTTSVQKDIVRFDIAMSGQYSSNATPSMSL